MRFLDVEREPGQIDRWYWSNFVSRKLVPFHYVIPVGADLQEWSREYRDLLFEMAAFLDARGSLVTRDLAREFLKGSDAPALEDFSLEDIQLLLAKARDYHLSDVN